MIGSGRLPADRAGTAEVWMVSLGRGAICAGMREEVYDSAQTDAHSAKAAQCTPSVRHTVIDYIKPVNSENIKY